MATKVKVALLFNNVVQYFQREREEKRNGRWTAVPWFVVDKQQAAVLTEEAGSSLVRRLRSLREEPWLEDASTGNRIDVPHEVVSYAEDTRQPMRVTLDDVIFYIARPANTPQGPRWFVRCMVPGRPEPEIIYSETVIGAAQRAADIGFLQFAERTGPPPAPQQETERKVYVPRVRPGSL